MKRLSAASLIVALGLSLLGCSASAPPVASDQTSPSAQADPSNEKNNQTVEHDPIVTAENRDAVLKSLQIDSSLSPEEKAEKVAGLITRWTMAGATPEVITMDQKNAAEGVEPQSENLAKQVAERNRDVFAEATYGANWQDTHLDVVNQSVVNNADAIYKYMTTFGSEAYPNANSLNEEAFTESFSENVQLVGWADTDEASHPSFQPYVDRARQAFESTDPLVLSIVAERSNNADKNQYQQDPSYAEHNGALLYMHVVLIPENGNDVVRYSKYETYDFGDTVDY